MFSKLFDGKELGLTCQRIVLTICSLEYPIRGLSISLAGIPPDSFLCVEVITASYLFCLQPREDSETSLQCWCRTENLSLIKVLL